MKVLLAIEDARRIDITENFLSGLVSSGTITIKILHVITKSDENAAENSGELFHNAETLVKSTCTRLSRRFPGAEVEGCVRKGAIKQEIIDEARAWQTDLIMLGPYGKRGSNEILEVNEAQRILPGVTCTVVLLSSGHERSSVYRANRQTAILCALFMQTLIISCLSAAAGDQPIRKEVTGKDYFQQYCASCHIGGGNLVNGTKPVAGSPVLKNLAIFQKYLENPPGHMPYYKSVVSDQKIIQKLYQYCKKLKKTEST